MDRFTNTIKPTAPFDFDLTAGYHTYFRGSYGTDTLEDNAYRRLLDLGDKLALVSVRSVGSVDAPELLVDVIGEGLSPEDAAAATRQASWLLGAEQELEPFYSAVRGDPVMSNIAGQLNGLHLPHTATVFESLVLAILGQQLATNVARIIRTLMIETYGLRHSFDGQEFFAFPRPETLAAATVEELRQLKLSQRKAEYVHGIALAALDGSGMFDSLAGLPDDEVIKQMLSLRGVGKWTAQWVLVRALGRPDALPLGDLALRRVVSRLYFDGETIDDAQLEEFAERWRPWRTYATVYLFTALRAGMG